jgi:hypothetical protein
MGEIGARLVGEFIPPKPLIRSMKNPNDKATIVSIYPKDIIKERKHTLNPGEWSIPAGKIDFPSVTVIGVSSWWQDLGDQRPAQEIPVSSVAIAESLIRDYCSGLLGASVDTAMPGLFYIPGELTVEKVQKDYKMKIAEAKLKQDRWFQTLVKLADGLWSRSNNNPLVIMDEMKLAAMELGIDRLWTKNFSNVEMVKCKGCGNIRNPEFPICPSCRMIDQDHPEAKNLKFAAQ